VPGFELKIQFPISLRRVWHHQSRSTREADSPTALYRRGDRYRQSALGARNVNHGRAGMLPQTLWMGQKGKPNRKDTEEAC